MLHSHYYRVMDFTAVSQLVCFSYLNYVSFKFTVYMFIIWISIVTKYILNLIYLCLFVIEFCSLKFHWKYL
jgi:hypothetical protein